MSRTPSRPPVASLRAITSPPAGPGRLLGRAHTGGAGALAATPDGLVSVGADGLLCVWRDDVLVHEVRAPYPLCCVAYGAGRVFAGGPEGSLLLTLDTGEARELAQPAGVVVASGAGFVAGGPDQNVQRVAADGSGEVLATLGHNVQQLVALPDGLVASDGFYLWWLPTVGEPRSHELDPMAPERVHRAAVYPLSDTHVLVALDHEVMCLYVETQWAEVDPRTGAYTVLDRGPTLVAGHGLATRGVEISAALRRPELSYVLDRSGALRRFDHPSIGATVADAGSEVALDVGALAFGSADPARFATLSRADNRIRWWSLEDGALLTDVTWRYMVAQTLHQTPGGRLIARGDKHGPGGTATLIALEADGTRLWDVRDVMRDVAGAAVSESGRLAATVGARHRLWESGRPLFLTDHQAWGRTERHADWACVGGSDGHLACWDLRAGTCLWTWRTRAGQEYTQGPPIDALANTHDGFVVLARPARAAPHSVRVLDHQSGELLREAAVMGDVDTVPKIVRRDDGTLVVFGGGAWVWPPNGALRAIPGAAGFRAVVLQAEGRYGIGDLGHDKPQVVVDTVTRQVSEIDGVAPYGTTISAWLPDGRVALLNDGVLVLVDPAAATSRRWPSHAEAVAAVPELASVTLKPTPWESTSVVLRADYSVCVLDADTLETRWIHGGPDGWRHAGNPVFEGEHTLRVPTLSGTTVVELASGAMTQATPQPATPRAAPLPSVVNEPNGARSVRWEGCQVTLRRGRATLATWVHDEPIADVRWPRADRVVVLDARGRLVLLEPSSE